jgi:hypothetical protein
MGHKEWLKAMKDCPLKTYDGSRLGYLGRLKEGVNPGHPICGEAGRFQTGRRCMYRTCPKRGKE